MPAPPRPTVNPTLREWTEPGGETHLIWRDPATDEESRTIQTDLERVVITMAREGITEEEAARLAGISPDRVAEMVDGVAARGIVSMPEPGLHRTERSFPLDGVPESMISCGFFTLQWHLTNACDLHCAHCYDRTRLKALKLPETLAILEDFVVFLRRHRMRGELCLTGGNPLLYPRFDELYAAIAETGLEISILGNPTTRERIERLVAMKKPYHFQLSLEGLAEHNDAIRGAGHFDRVMEFLPLLRDLDIETGIMLTLTRDNIDQALPLAERLRDVVDSFTFNRLAQVGQGSNLAIASGSDYQRFVSDWEAAAGENPIMGLKDNLFNVLRHERDQPLIDGCTGFGCGAAFNFLAVLPTGEAHACRKFPSPVGDVHEDGIEAVYYADAAQRYRDGCTACRDCVLRAACGGCLAVSQGAGLDPLTEIDPHCWHSRS